jgi:low affinity Fe/Cu permease
MKRAFQTVAQAASRGSGSPRAFMLAFSVVLVWAVTGPFFNFSDTWQLVINTSTTIVTFLMVFLIQNTQNRDTIALHAKVDELIIRLDGADNALVNAEDMSDDELSAVMEKEKALAASMPNGSEAFEAAHAAEHAEAELTRRERPGRAGAA